MAQEILGLFAGDPKRWTQKEYAKDSDGDVVGAASTRAVCWCLGGACYKLDYSMAAQNRLAMAMGVDSLVKFNDAPQRSFYDIEKKLKLVAGYP